MGFKKTIPKITVGKYAGTPIDQLPMSYLRWMMTQDFPKEWMEIADRKIKSSADTATIAIEISRHAIDQFSLRFWHVWVDSADSFPPTTGLASFITTKAQEAWDNGKDVSKRRHQNDGVVKQYEGIKWVFGTNPSYPEYRDLITVMVA